MRLNLINIYNILDTGNRMKKPHFATNSFYHIYNRGVEKRDVFLDAKDYFRFIHDLFEFNDEAPALNLYYKLPSFKSYEVEPRKIIRKRELLVDIIAYCLMPNHFHLLLRQRQEDGIVRFMQKLGTGYTMYFNQKYQRVGALFQGRFRAALIEKESHFVYLPHYIHLNPLDLYMPDWRDRRISDWRKAIKYLRSYRWSSYPDYIGEKNFPSLMLMHYIRELFGSSKIYSESLREWIADMDFNLLAHVILE